MTGWVPASFPDQVFDDDVRLAGLVLLVKQFGQSQFQQCVLGMPGQ
jgi:hypothetical protein